jgi:hypothetical protein
MDIPGGQSGEPDFYPIFFGFVMLIITPAITPYSSITSS